MKPILTSAFETDFYKETMANMIFHQFPEVQVRWKLITRSKVQYPPGFAERLREQLIAMADLAPTDQEMQYIEKNADFLDPAYREWRRNYRFNPDEVFIEQKGGDLSVIVESLWFRSTHLEVPLLETTCPLYFEMMDLKPAPNWQDHTREKMITLYEHGIPWADFSTRRAPSRAAHEEALMIGMEYMQRPGRPGGLVGTSCVSMAVKHGLKLIGTMGHEPFIVLGAILGYPIANTMVMDCWIKQFKGRLGTVLTDTFTTEEFLRKFTAEYAKLFDGTRNDSMEEIQFAKDHIAHYQSLGIDPLTKTLIFSNSLDVAKMIKIADFCRGKIGFSNGWGGKIFWPQYGPPPLDGVVKPMAARVNSRHPWLPAVKLSDILGKVTDAELASAVRLILGIPNP